MTANQYADQAQLLDFESQAAGQEPEKPRPESPLTMSDMVESLTGYDELAVEKHYGGPISDLMNTKPTMGIRALVFISKTRDGLNPVEAKKQSMGLSMKQALAYFTPDAEPFPEEPVTEEGKEVSGSENELASWPPSAFSPE